MRLFPRRVTGDEQLDTRHRYRDDTLTNPLLRARGYRL